MTNENNIKLFLEKLASDAEFAEKAFNAESPEDLQKLAAVAGIELTMDDIMESKEILSKAFDKLNQNELSDKDLEDVAGGMGVATATAITVGVPILYDIAKDNGWTRGW